MLFFTAAFAETKRAPFDVPEGESEIIGYFVEYSGMKFGLFMIAEFVEIVVLAGGHHRHLLRRLAPAFVGDALAHRLPRSGAPASCSARSCGTVFWIKVLLLC